ncbi:unnamed protein product, partial [Hapterophycus canaliculatus]
RALDQGRLQVLFNLVMADMHLTLLEQRLQERPGAAEDVNDGVDMLQHCAQFGGCLAKDGHDMDKYVKRVEKARQTIGDVAASRMAAVAERYKLPSLTRFQAGDVKLPKVVLPSPRQRPSADAGGVAGARARSTTNLRGLPSMREDGPLTPKRLDDLMLWAAHKGSGKEDLQSNLVLQEVEGLLFGIFADQGIQATAKTFGKDDTSKLVKLVELYRSVLNSLLGARSLRGRMEVELRSRETLVVWIAYAVSFAVARDQAPESMANFGVCLKPDDLKYLVLPHKLAVDAGLRVADFLRSHARGNLAVFTLADGGRATFSLAANVARRSSQVRDIWKKEVIAAERRRGGHWTIVKALQKERIEIRGKLRVSKRKLQVQDSSLERATAVREMESCDCSDGRFGVLTCDRCEDMATASRACDATKREIATFERRLKETETIPPVFQPLPKDETAAYQVLFFLHMPEVFRSLAHLSFQAQQMLLPRKWDTPLTKAVQRPPCRTLWSAYYNSSQSSKYLRNLTETRRGQDGAVKLGFDGELGKPEKMVDHCSTPSDGVWHPDALLPGCMVWEGGTFSADVRPFSFDPFSP